MKEASGAPSPKNSRNAPRRGMLLTPLGSRLRPAPHEKATGSPTCARSAAPLDRSTALPRRWSCRRKAWRAHARPQGATATRCRSRITQPTVGGIARELATSRGHRTIRFHEQRPNRCRPAPSVSRIAFPRRWVDDAAGEAGLRRPKASPGNRLPRHPGSNADARAPGPAPNLSNNRRCRRHPEARNRRAVSARDRRERRLPSVARAEHCIVGRRFRVLSKA